MLNLTHWTPFVLFVLGSSRTSECLLDLDPIRHYEHANSTMTGIIVGNRQSTLISLPPVQCVQRDRVSSLLHHCDRDNSQLGTSGITEGVYSLKNNAASVTKCGGNSDVCPGLDGPSLSLNNVLEGLEDVDSHDPLDFGEYFQEGYCKVSQLNGSHNSNEIITDANSNSSLIEKEKSEEDEDDMLGCVFAFSEEGKYDTKLVNIL